MEEYAEEWHKSNILIILVEAILKAFLKFKGE